MRTELAAAEVPLQGTEQQCVYVCVTEREGEGDRYIPTLDIVPSTFSMGRQLLE